MNRTSPMFSGLVLSALVAFVGACSEGNGYGPAYPSPPNAQPPTQRVVPSECEGFLRGTAQASTQQMSAFCLSQGCTCDAMNQASYPACGIFCTATMAQQMSAALVGIGTAVAASATTPLLAPAAPAASVDPAKLGPFPPSGAPASVTAIPAPAAAPRPR